MIQNERQYKITKTQAAKFRQALLQIRSKPSDLPIPHAKLERDALAGRLETLQSELKEYQRLRSGRFPGIRNQPVLALSEALVRARIPNNMTQEQLAAELNLHPQQIQKYEATGYGSANLEQLASVADVLGVKVLFLQEPRGKSESQNKIFELEEIAERVGPQVSGLALGRLVGIEPTTSRTTIWRYYRLSYSRRTAFSLTFWALTSG